MQDDIQFLAALPDALALLGNKTRTGDLLSKYAFRHKRQPINRFKIYRILSSNNITQHDKETITMFLYSQGIEFDSNRGIFFGKIQHTAFSPYAIDISEYLLGKYVLIYDLKQSRPDSKPRYNCAYIEMKINKNMPYGISGRYWVYSKESEPSEDEKASIEFEFAQTNNNFIKLSPVNHDRFDRPSATFLFRIIHWIKKPILVGLGLGFNDDDRDYIVAVRVIGLPIINIIRDKMPDIVLEEENPDSVRLFKTLDGILKGEHFLDVDGAIHVGASHAYVDESNNIMRLKHIEALSWLWE